MLQRNKCILVIKCRTLLLLLYINNIPILLRLPFRHFPKAGKTGFEPVRMYVTVLQEVWCDFGHHYLLDSVHPTPLCPLVFPNTIINSPFPTIPFSSGKLYSFVTLAIDRDFFHDTSASASIVFRPFQIRDLTQLSLTSSLPFGIGTKFLFSSKEFSHKRCTFALFSGMNKSSQKSVTD